MCRRNFLSFPLCLKLAFLLLMVTALDIDAQEKYEWEDVLQEIIANDEEEVYSWEDLYETLQDMADQPLDLNTATDEEIGTIPFLTAKQVEDLCTYRYRYGPILSLDELIAVTSIDYYRRKLMRYFTYVTEKNYNNKEKFPNLSTLLKYGKNEIATLVKLPTYERKGDKKGYAGYPIKSWLRYNFTYGQYVKLGVTAAQDAGEPFFSGTNKTGYDFYSLYAVVRDLGRFQTIAIGRYKLSTGMGLVLNSNFSMGKLSVLSNLGRNVNTIRAHSSTTEYGYFQGVAAKVDLSHRLSATAFVSYRPYDATLDSLGNVKTIITSGYHRTKSEIEKRHNTDAFASGLNVNYIYKRMHLGVTSVFSHYNRDLKPDRKTLYKRYYARGNNFINVGLDYGIARGKFSFNGETATNKDGALATINALSIDLSDILNLMLLHRFYSYKYTSLYANSFGNNSNAQNEHGVYAGIDWKPLIGLSIRAFADFSYSPWAKYQISRSSHFSDNMLIVSYQHKGWNTSIRYRFKYKQGDNATKTALIDNYKHTVRLSSKYSSSLFSLQTSGDLAISRYKEDGHGYMVSEDITLNIGHLKLQGIARYFNTSNYECRIYSYENGPLYSYSIPSFYGEGIRYAFLLHAKPWDWLTLNAKVATTNYFDRSTIGSSYQQINSSSQTDIELQARIRL